jgi:hypothetical protein
MGSGGVAHHETGQAAGSLPRLHHCACNPLRLIVGVPRFARHYMCIDTAAMVIAGQAASVHPVLCDHGVVPSLLCLCVF